MGQLLPSQMPDPTLMSPFHSLLHLPSSYLQPMCSSVPYLGNFPCSCCLHCLLPMSAHFPHFELSADWMKTLEEWNLDCRQACTWISWLSSTEGLCTAYSLSWTLLVVWILLTRSSRCWIFSLCNWHKRLLYDFTLGVCLFHNILYLVLLSGVGSSKL